MAAGRFCAPAGDIAYLAGRDQLERRSGVLCLPLPGGACPVYRLDEQLRAHSDMGKHQSVLVFSDERGPCLGLASDHVIKFRTARQPTAVPECMGGGPVSGLIWQQDAPVYMIRTEGLIRYLEQVIPHVLISDYPERLAG
ncbi:MAG: hypothetical protein D6758_05255 [Gammaproteobacteria bacterium]|nr:MAG: hypothetical protein D6758_05255 [Gammaproteobacteria bacterium]